MSSLPTYEDDRELVELAKADPTHFGELYDRHFTRIYRFVYSRVGDQTAAEDVTSEVFIKALRGLPRYQDTGRPFTAWLYQIAQNAVHDRYRSARATVELDELHDLAQSGPDLADVAARKDQLRAIWQIVEDLPRAQRTALVLKFQEDLKIEDIAIAMNRSPGAVKLLIHRGVAKLRIEAGPLEAWGSIN
ncbi:MAG TPA: RNA polymerase sigma factor [Candidatus Dormibacteraeota bacterium]|nr:RNA polymerase sigma factor [Candidatus Dormibacteraeota bacterium]